MENKLNSKNNYLILGSVLLVAIAAILVAMHFLVKDGTKYVVTFDTLGGTTVSKQEVKKGEKVLKPSDPEKEGFIFAEWLLDNTSFDFSTPVNENITLTASWILNSPEKELITVKFETDGGTTISNQVIEKGSKVLKPNNPEKEGHKFVNWYLNDVVYNFDEMVNEDITIKAKWEAVSKNKYTVKFNSNGGSSVASQTIEEGNKASRPSNPTRSGYTFKGWLLNGNSYDFNTPVTGNITLTANWAQNSTTPAKNKYTVTFNSNGGSSVASQTIEEGNKASMPANPARNGYTFKGWTLNGSAYDFNSPVNGNITLTANWEEIIKNKYTVTFNSNGGSSVASQTIEEGNKVSTPANPTRSGYTFKGWLLNGNSYDFNAPVTGNTTLTAKWEQKSYVVKTSLIDQYSPDRILTVYEDGAKISVSSIKYNGVTLCNGNNLVVNMYEIAGISSLTVVLTDGTIVTASVQ